jgi:hypothetical protein
MLAFWAFGCRSKEHLPFLLFIVMKGHDIKYLTLKSSGPGGLRSHDNWLRRLVLLFERNSTLS